MLCPPWCNLLSFLHGTIFIQRNAKHRRGHIRRRKSDRGLSFARKATAALLQSPRHAPDPFWLWLDVCDGQSASGAGAAIECAFKNQTFLLSGMEAGYWIVALSTPAWQNPPACIPVNLVVTHCLCIDYYSNVNIENCPKLLSSLAYKSFVAASDGLSN